MILSRLIAGLLIRPASHGRPAPGHAYDTPLERRR